ncbi:MAG: histidine kinase dimerization/phospho-acceptor domain-containing protein [Gemmatimonadaceae bacterium]|nr:histidine kinase dimerization/phospho-acceptor domain-containing protein [Gemmatimonadaceae bacterium]
MGIYPAPDPNDDGQAAFPTGPAAVALRHALNNPLTAILAEAQLLQLEPLPPEQAQSVARIVEQCRRLVAITRKLEDPSRRIDDAR